MSAHAFLEFFKEYESVHASSQHRAKFGTLSQQGTLTLFETLGSFEIIGLKTSGEWTAFNHN